MLDVTDLDILPGLRDRFGASLANTDEAGRLRGEPPPEVPQRLPDSGPERIEWAAPAPRSAGSSGRREPTAALPATGAPRRAASGKDAIETRLPEARRAAATQDTAPAQNAAQPSFALPEPRRDSAGGSNNAEAIRQEASRIERGPLFAETAARSASPLLAALPTPRSSSEVFNQPAKEQAQAEGKPAPLQLKGTLTLQSASGDAVLDAVTT